MTVVRGDAARSLMARTRAAQRHQVHRPGQGEWARSTGITHESSDDGTARACGLLRDQLAGTAMADRQDDAVVVISELVANALSVARSVWLRLHLVETSHLLVEVMDDADSNPQLCGALARLGAGPVPTPSGGGLDVVRVLASDWGIRPDPMGKCVWARLDRARP